MSQTDYNVPNSTSETVLNKLNSIFGSIATNNSGSTAPTATFGSMFWHDTGNNKLKQRTQTNDGWMDLFHINVSAGQAGVPLGMPVYNNSGDQVGKVGTYTQGNWNDGVATVDALISPAKLSAAVAELSPPSLGQGQSWAGVTRAIGTSYQNTTGKPVQVLARYAGGGVDTVIVFEVSTNGSTWVTIDSVTGQQTNRTQAIIPDNHYYRVRIAGGTASATMEGFAILS